MLTFRQQQELNQIGHVLGLNQQKDGQWVAKVRKDNGEVVDVPLNERARERGSVFVPNPMPI